MPSKKYAISNPSAAITEAYESGFGVGFVEGLIDARLNALERKVKK